MNSTTHTLLTKGKYKSAPFFFRGGDIFIEAEYKANERINCMKLLERAQEDFKQAKIEYDSEMSNFRELESYSVRVSSSFGLDTSRITEDSLYRSKIAQLQKKIDETELKIADMKKMLSPSDYLGIMNEHTSFQRELDLLNSSMLNTHKSTEDIWNEIGKTLISEEYSYARDSKSEMMVATQCQDYIKKSLSSKFSSLNSQQSSDNGKRTAYATNVMKNQGSDLVPLIDDLSETHESRIETDLSLMLCQNHYVQTIKGLLEHVAEINGFLIQFGFTGEDLSEISKLSDPNYEMPNLEENTVVTK